MESIQDTGLGWRVLRDITLPGPEPCVLTLVALHPGHGIALVDTLPMVTPDAVPRLHLRLRQGQFFGIYGPDSPAILHLALHPWEMDRLESILAEAFQGRPVPMLPGDDAWMDTAARLLATEAPSLVPRQPLAARLSATPRSLASSLRHRAIPTAFALVGLVLAWASLPGLRHPSPIPTELASIGEVPAGLTPPELKPQTFPLLLEPEATPPAVVAKATRQALPMTTSPDATLPMVVAGTTPPALLEPQATIPVVVDGELAPVQAVQSVAWMPQPALPAPPFGVPPNPAQAWSEAPVALAVILPPNPVPFVPLAPIPVTIPPAPGVARSVPLRAVNPVAIVALPPPIRPQVGPDVVRMEYGCRVLVQRIQTGEEASEDELLRLHACRKGG